MKPLPTVDLTDTYTSTGAKFAAHPEAMAGLRAGRGRAITAHIMCTDICNHKCAFCSVQARAGDVLPFEDILGFVDILLNHGLKSCILSGGGNPILYRDKGSGKNFNDVVDVLHTRGLEIGLITNGMPLREYDWMEDGFYETSRMSWRGVLPATLDKLTWVRISMSGLDHLENEVYVPDIDPTKTTLGFSYCAHTIFDEPADPHHGKVSTVGDLITLDRTNLRTWTFEERMCDLTHQIRGYVEQCQPKYVRLLPDCLAPELIADRCIKLQLMADEINRGIGQVAFVQSKPPRAPNVCLIGAFHPVLNCDGFVYPCDAVVLAAAERGYRTGTPNHKFDDPWRVCHWSDIGKLYEGKLPHSLIHDPGEKCRGCVFSAQNDILESVRDGVITLEAPAQLPSHANFI